MKKIRYHLVDQSPWPFVLSGTVFNMITMVVYYLHNGYTISSVTFKQTYWWFNYGYLIAFVLTVIVISFWLRDIIREGTFEGQHTYLVR